MNDLRVCDAADGLEDQTRQCHPQTQTPLANRIASSFELKTARQPVEQAMENLLDMKNAELSQLVRLEQIHRDKSSRQSLGRSSRLRSDIQLIRSQSTHSQKHFTEGFGRVAALRIHQEALLKSKGLRYVFST